MRGTIRAKSVGFFTYDKRQEEDGIIVPCAVRVFPLLVKRQDKTWPEYRQRQSQWFVPEEALSAVKEESFEGTDIFIRWESGCKRLALSSPSARSSMGCEVSVSLAWDALCDRQAYRADRSQGLTSGSSESYRLINSSISANTLVTAINHILRINSSV